MPLSERYLASSVPAAAIATHGFEALSSLDVSDDESLDVTCDIGLEA
jgi:hypothetical protein